LWKYGLWAVPDYDPMTARIVPENVRWFMRNKTAHFFTKIAGVPERIPVVEYGDKHIKSQPNKSDKDNLLNLPDIHVESGTATLDFEGLQHWVERMAGAVVAPVALS